MTTPEDIDLDFVPFGETGLQTSELQFLSLIHISERAGK
ncbi:oxidoreductase, partial [Haloferax gibbonsii ATCC 33959]